MQVTSNTFKSVSHKLSQLSSSWRFVSLFVRGNSVLSLNAFSPFEWGKKTIQEDQSAFKSGLLASAISELAVCFKSPQEESAQVEAKGSLTANPLSCLIQLASAHPCQCPSLLIIHTFTPPLPLLSPGIPFTLHCSCFSRSFPSHLCRIVFCHQIQRRFSACEA